MESMTRFGMGSVGTGGLLWLLATGCGEKDGSPGSETANGSGGSASSTSATNSTGTETGPGIGTTTGAMGSNTVAGSTTGTGTSETSTASSGSMGTGGSSSSCPAIEPAPGTSCGEDGLSCTFTNCAAPNYRNDHTLICERGAWALASEVECLPDCPNPRPLIGSACEAQQTPGPCPVATGCAVVEASCVDGVWSAAGVSDRLPMPPEGTGGSSGIIGEPLCPETVPEVYTPCCPAAFPDYCDYRGRRPDFLLPPTGTTTGAQGSGGTVGDSATAGGTGAPGLCLACDPTRLEWVVTDACD